MTFAHTHTPSHHQHASVTTLGIIPPPPLSKTHLKLLSLPLPSYNNPATDDPLVRSLPRLDQAHEIPFGTTQVCKLASQPACLSCIPPPPFPPQPHPSSPNLFSTPPPNRVHTRPAQSDLSPSRSSSHPEHYPPHASPHRASPKPASHPAALKPARALTRDHFPSMMRVKRQKKTSITTNLINAQSSQPKPNSVLFTCTLIPCPLSENGVEKNPRDQNETGTPCCDESTD
jgi:hypothetical protein